ncbi:MAG TPA: NUDIX domain-containing protein [Anaerolineales bacterium]|jgi:ADP-ribose pyrophosphatase YjhB (NUDIX family)
MRSEDVKFCPRCGAAVKHEFHFGQFRPVCKFCGWLFFADPKVAVAVLVEREGRILLVQRANEPHRGLWTLPAGFVNAGEDPAAAAARECLEETGLSVEITGLLDIVSGREHARGSDFVIFYRGRAARGELLAGDDAASAGWFERDKLPDLAFKSTSHILTRY